MDRVETCVHHMKGGGVVLELAFQDGHWQFDTEIRESIADAVRATAPAAILVDLTRFRYRGGDYVSGFIEAFLDKSRPGVRPACFLGAPQGVRRLFDAIDPARSFAIHYFDDRAEALDYLRDRLEPTG